MIVVFQTAGRCVDTEVQMRQSNNDACVDLMRIEMNHKRLCVTAVVGRMCVDFSPSIDRSIEKHEDVQMFTNNVITPVFSPLTFLFFGTIFRRNRRLPSQKRNTHLLIG